MPTAPPPVPAPTAPAAPPKGRRGRCGCWIVALVVVLLLACLSVGIIAMFIPGLAPAGQPRLAFAAEQADEVDIYVTNAEGNDVTKLTDGIGINISPRWAPDGRSIVFLSDRDGAGQQIYLTSIAGGELTRLSAARSFDSAPDWSPDGSQIVFVADVDADSQIHLMNADGSGRTRITQGVEDDEPEWSPDGLSIAFVSLVRDEDQTDIFVMNPDGSGQRNLSNTAELGEWAPSWSPDGQSILFVSDWDIVIMSADGSNETVLTAGLPAESFSDAPAWSPDGSMIAFVLEFGDDRFELMVMDADGSNRRSLGSAREPGFWRPEWSPDGTMLAYAVENRDEPELFVVGVDGSDKMRIADAPSLGAVWAPAAPRSFFELIVSELGSEPTSESAPATGSKPKAMARAQPTVGVKPTSTRPPVPRATATPLPTAAPPTVTPQPTTTPSPTVTLESTTAPVPTPTEIPCDTCTVDRSIEGIRFRGDEEFLDWTRRALDLLATDPISFDQVTTHLEEVILLPDDAPSVNRIRTKYGQWMLSERRAYPDWQPEQQSLIVYADGLVFAASLTQHRDLPSDERRVRAYEDAAAFTEAVGAPGERTNFLRECAADVTQDRC